MPRHFIRAGFGLKMGLHEILPTAGIFVVLQKKRYIVGSLSFPVTMRIFYLILLIMFCSASQVKSQNRIPGFPDPEPESVRFYPNPATSFITFDFIKNYGRNYSLQVFNFLGKKVYEFSAADQKTVLNLSDFFRGIYIFQLKDPNGKIVQSGKFQVNK
jgi:hypothetical protein